MTEKSATDLKKLENEFDHKPGVDSLVPLIDAYLSRGQRRFVEKALSLILHNLERYGREPKFLDGALRVLVLIRDNAEAMSLAFELARRSIELDPNPASYLNAAYVHWQLGNVAAAIELSEQGLARWKDEPAAGPGLLQLKDNLAYYYAERGLPSDAEKARTLASETYQSEPIASRADTLGFVLLRFSRDRQDIERALELFLNAEEQLKRSGLTNSLVPQHRSEAEARLRGTDYKR